MANDLSTKMWSNALPMDVALGIYQPEDLYELHNLNEEQLRVYLNHPLFQQEVAELRREMKDTGATFKAKARVLAEHLIDRMYDIIANEDTSPAIRMKGIENVVRWAGYDRKPVDDTPEVAQATQVPSIEIVLNGLQAAPAVTNKNIYDA